MKNWLISTYEKLGLDTTALQDISSRTDPYTTFTQITKALVAEPEKYSTIIDEIINTPSIRIYFSPGHRLNIAKIFPEDKETALKLLVDTTSYYKSIYRSMGRDDDGEDIEVHCGYRLITHCADYYFLRTAYNYHEYHPGLKAVLEENGINTSELKYYTDNDAFKKLNQFHKERQI
jgi:hypothetical protein